MTCRKGDIAIVVRAKHECNLGTIVRILDVDDGKGDLAFKNESLVWSVSCDYPMTWSKNGRLFLRTEGPVPDWKLQPIRGGDKSEKANSESKSCRSAKLQEQREEIVSNMSLSEIRTMDYFGFTVSEYVVAVEAGMLKWPKVRT
ncbi:MAG: hypothetical protein ING66_07385 [Rhodocyclaceae bacterium]|jgi:hypothetical protein|nr:hypothetical protein [Rhodocyclaceae bacterium]MCA3021456.1 hypothetical protein [Rhodocyclaceae bacterium]MCA3028406.1 hypothetical protein [Rhodocyclaceae bacterium]MCA3044009.1 hypothetical protein [Rhodocyclaceae bacterium]MCA3054204.1 hypothetical protein [Rhodocyclaceae bacterium]